MSSNTRYQARIVPILQEIQAADGYLRRDKMEQAAKRLGEPLYKLHAVASFFPHFRVTPPPKVSIHICRDTACHMAGASGIDRKSTRLNSSHVEISYAVFCLKKKKGEAGLLRSRLAASQSRRCWS